MKQIIPVSILFVFIFGGCTRYVTLPQKLPSLIVPDRIEPPIMKTGKAEIVGVSGRFCTSETLLQGHALIVFPKSVTHYKDEYVIVRKRDYDARLLNTDAIEKVAKQQSLIIRENNKKALK